MTTKTEDFCRSIIQLPVESAKPLANLVMAAASYAPTHTVVGLSQSPLYHYQWESRVEKWQTCRLGKFAECYNYNSLPSTTTFANAMIPTRICIRIDRAIINASCVAYKA